MTAPAAQAVSNKKCQTTFADAVRGLHVYGGRLVRPDHIAVAGVKRPAGI